MEAREAAGYGKFLFVYGTLRRQAATAMSDLVDRECVFFAEGILRGRLYEVDGYPGAVTSDHADDLVRGELFRMENADRILARLDEYEECTGSHPQPHEYRRQLLPIRTIDGKEVLAWVYLYNRDIGRLRRIGSGDYAGFLASRQASP